MAVTSDHSNNCNELATKPMNVEQIKEPVYTLNLGSLPLTTEAMVGRAASFQLYSGVYMAIFQLKLVTIATSGG